MSRTRRAPGSILLVTLGAAAGWVGAPVGVAVLMAQTSFGTSQPKSQPSMQKVQPSPKPSMQKAQPSPKKMQFDQARSRAMSGKPPGGNPGGESNAFMERLKRRHESKVESQNARVQAMFGRLPVPPTGGGGKKGPPPGVNAPGTGPAPMKPPPDPCEGRPLEIKAIQTSPPLEPGEKVFIDGCGFGYPTDSPRSEVFLYGDGFPGGRQKLTVEGCLPRGIIARVPPMQGVPDIPTARLQVVRGSNISAQVDVGGFRATREVRRLLPADIQVDCWYPGPPTAQNSCKLASNYPGAEAQFFAGATFAAKHSSNASEKDCDDSALDLLGTGYEEHSETYAFNLKNEWKFAAYAWWWGEQGDGYAYAPAGIAQDARAATLTMTWGLYVNYCAGPRTSSVRYRVDLYAVGPKGIPYK